MSWVSDYFSDQIGRYGRGVRDFWSIGGENDVSRFFQNEVVNKADLRGAQLDSVLSGVPYVGQFIRGVEGVQQLEDLYNATGKTAQYASLSGNAGSLGSLAGSLTRKIEDGVHDLGQYYSGDATLEDHFERTKVNNIPGYKPKINETGWKSII